MIRLEVRRYHSPDVLNLEAWSPPDPGRFEILIQVIAGPAGLPGDESFDIVLSTTSMLRERVATSGVVNGRHQLFVDWYDWSSVTRYIETYAASCEGETWLDAAAKFGRLGRWEFEDYIESSR